MEGFYGQKGDTRKECIVRQGHLSLENRRGLSGRLEEYVVVNFITIIFLTV